MEKTVITREDLKAYPKNKVINKNYHKFKLNKNLSEKSMNTTVKMLYQVMAGNKGST